jgi:hypothetical protein
VSSEVKPAVEQAMNKDFQPICWKILRQQNPLQARLLMPHVPVMQRVKPAK